jgi:hypothetical protein
MQSDSSYLYNCEKVIRILLDATHGDWESIPQEYLDYFYYEFSDGDISLIPAVNTFANTDFLEIWQVEEAAELLRKVDPKEWPDVDDIVQVNVPSLLEFDELSAPANLEKWQFVEDNLSTSDIVQRALKGVIESVFGKGISQIRSKTGQYPSSKNNFLLERDGTFAGMFKYNDFSFEFEIAPTEKGWLCTYRLDEKSLDKLEKPEFKGKRDHKVNRRKVRSRGWR